jgi:hypothetical protein
MRQKAYLVIGMMLLGSSLSWAVPRANPGQGFSLYYHVPKTNPRTSGAHFMFHAGAFDSLDELPGQLANFQAPEEESGSRPDSSHPVRVVVVVPKGAPSAYVDAYAAKVKSVIGQKLGTGVPIVTSFSYVDADVEAEEYAQFAHELEETIPEIQRDPSSQEAVRSLAEQMEEEARNVRTWRDATSPRQ